MPHGTWQGPLSLDRCAERKLTFLASPARRELRCGASRNKIRSVNRLLKKLVLALAVLALPAQGLMAATMPLCGHQAGGAQHQPQNEGYDAAYAHANPLEHASAHEHAKDPGTSGLQCHDCASCQVCTSPALTGFNQTLQAPVAALPQSAPAVKISPFFPELFQRPPLALAA
jgi:hypothetical protein